MAGKKLTDAQRALNKARDDARRRAMGPSLALTDAALDGLSTVDASLQAQVEAYVRQAAGQPGVDLLQAKASVDG